MHRLAGFFFEPGLQIAFHDVGFKAAAECVVFFHVISYIGPMIVAFAAIARSRSNFVALGDQVKFVIRSNVYI